MHGYPEIGKSCPLAQHNAWLIVGAQSIFLRRINKSAKCNPEFVPSFFGFLYSGELESFPSLRFNFYLGGVGTPLAP